MLELTQTTIETVNELSKASSMGGLRIFRHRRREALVLAAALVDGPSAGDEVVEDGGALVFVDADTADAVADKRLDAYVADGRVYLSLLERS